MFLTHSDEALEIEKFKRSKENKIEFAYDYGNLSASYVNEKINFEDDYFQEIINPDFEKIDSPFQQTSSLKPYVPNVILEKIIIDLEDKVVNHLEKEKVNLETIDSLKSKGVESSETVSSESENQSETVCHVVEKQCGNMSSKAIAPGMFKLSVSQYASSISMSKSSCDSNNVKIKLKRKRRKRKSSKQNVKQVDNDVSRTNSDFVYFLDLDTFSSVRRPKNSGVIWKKKESFNTSNVGLSAVSVSNLNKNVKRYSRKDLLAYLDTFSNVKRPKNSGVIWKKKWSYNTSNVDFEKIDSPFQQTSSLKLYVPTVILEKIIIDLKDEVVSLLKKDKAKLKAIESLKSKGFESSENAISESKNQSEKECDQVENSEVIAQGMFKLSVSQSVSPISIISKLNKDVKRYSRKDLLSCNNSHLGETSSAYVCNDAMNVSCNSRLCDSFDEKNLFIFDDESVRISPVSKMPFRKKPRDSMNVRSKSNSNKSLPRTVHRWLPKMQPLAEPVAK
nr:hypothetical protein [Tanacetum cinerariifolium]